MRSTPAAATPMRILGIDPGLQITGFGIVDVSGPALAYVASGTIRTTGRAARDSHDEVAARGSSGEVAARGRHGEVAACGVSREVAARGINSEVAARGDVPARIKLIVDGVREVVARWQPDCASVEIVFVNVNPQSTLLLGQARGAALAALLAADVDVAEYTALQMKQAVVGHGRAQKAQVQEMVKRLLKLPGLPGPDAADALGLAITQAHAGAALGRIAAATPLSRKTSGMYRAGRTR